jgi:hypothetical protein
MTHSWTLDQPYYLVGDEDCGVGLHCSTCDTGGRPIAWYDGYGVGNPYDETVVPTAHTVAQLVELGQLHVVQDGRNRTSTGGLT